MSVPHRRLACAIVVLTIAGVLAGAVGAAAPSFGCVRTPGLGSIALLHGAVWHEVDLATCRVRVTTHPPTGAGLRSPDGRLVAAVRPTGGGPTRRDAIWVLDARTHVGRRVFSTRVIGDTTGRDSPGPVWLLGWSGDSRWIVFTIDAGGSGSIAADGLIPQVISAEGGPAHRLPVTLPNADRFTWCENALVFTAGADRIATDGKRLLVARPPDWRPRPVVLAPNRAWGSLTCAPDDRSVVVESQPQSANANFFASHWAMWRVGLDGSQRRLTSPPAGRTDESPRFSRDGLSLLFVRSQHGVGRVYALRAGAALGPLLDLGYSVGYYGHRDWWQTMDWSLGVRPSL